MKSVSKAVSKKWMMIVIKNHRFLFDSLITNIFTNNSDFQAKLDYYKSYMHLLVSHFHFTNSLLTIRLQWSQALKTSKNFEGEFGK